jgi:hypothetical protein
MYIPPAVAWIRLAGVAIHKLCIEKYDSFATCQFLETGCNWEWTGGWGFSLERWQFWKQKLGELSAEQSLKRICGIWRKKLRREWRALDGPQLRY